MCGQWALVNCVTRMSQQTVTGHCSRGGPRVEERALCVEEGEGSLSVCLLPVQKLSM